MGTKKSLRKTRDPGGGSSYNSSTLEAEAGGLHECEATVVACTVSGQPRGRTDGACSKPSW